jgi:hypothetical protein
MENSTKVPMALVDVIKQQAVMKEQLALMVGEYWAPKEDWHVYEFLAGSMTIIEEVPGPKDGINGLSK